MTEEEIVAREYVFLMVELQRHERLYRELSDPEIDDHDYDVMFRTYERMSACHPELFYKYQWLSSQSWGTRIAEVA